MYFLALAADYDGTLAHDGVVSVEASEALERYKRAGGRLILVTGRRLASLQRAFPQYAMFDRIVAENGALLYDPAKNEERLLAPPASPDLVHALKQRGVAPLSIGRSIVATWEPQDRVVLEEIKALGLELQIIFNKGAVMVLPAGVNKAFGLAEALHELELSSKNVVAVGDAENDHAFLRACGCSAAVANALPSVKAEADLRLSGDHGQGVTELIELLTNKDSPLLPPSRHDLFLGLDAAGGEVRINVNVGTTLITGKSGIGKSTLATALTEHMVGSGFQFCVFDPEGDYNELEHSVCVGDAKSPPMLDEAIDLIRKVAGNVVINTQALSLEDRAKCFNKVLPRLLALRNASGRPHWVIVDEAHHQMDAARSDFEDLLPRHVRAMVFITVHPEAMSPNALRSVETVIAIGAAARDTIAAFCHATEVEVPPEIPEPADDQVVFWERHSDRGPFLVKPIRPRQVRERHKTKYAEGELEPESSFYFRGPEGKLKLRAQNLMFFLQLAEGVDEATWQFHRERGEYSEWFRRIIKDDDLGSEAAMIERDSGMDASESLRRIAEAVRKRYTVPSKAERNWHEGSHKAEKPSKGPA